MEISDWLGRAVYIDIYETCMYMHVYNCRNMNLQIYIQIYTYTVCMCDNTHTLTRRTCVFFLAVLLNRLWRPLSSPSLLFCPPPPSCSLPSSRALPFHPSRSLPRFLSLFLFVSGKSNVWAVEPKMQVFPPPKGYRFPGKSPACPWKSPGFPQKSPKCLQKNLIFSQ